jgi:hypothetical protein
VVCSIILYIYLGEVSSRRVFSDVRKRALRVAARRARVQ